MTGPISFILGALILTAVIAVCAVVVWLVFGRQKRSEDKVIGGMEQMAHFKATSYIDGMQRRVR